MDWSTEGFKLIYRACRMLIGTAISKIDGAPGLFTVLLKEFIKKPLWSPITAPSIAGTIAGVTLSFHSTHAQILFLAIRSVLKYEGHQRKLEEIDTSMQNFGEAIRTAINATSPVPVSLPSSDIKAFLDPNQNSEYKTVIDSAIAHILAYVAFQDLIISEITRCIQEWNCLLEQNKKFLMEDKPRNVFENISRIGVSRSREWTQYNYMTSFQLQTNCFVGHRNDWAKLLDLPKGPTPPRLNFE